MIIYLKAIIQIHNLKISNEKQLKEFKASVIEIIRKELDVDFNSDVEIEWIEQAGNFNRELNEET